MQRRKVPFQLHAKIHLEKEYFSKNIHLTVLEILGYEVESISQREDWTDILLLLLIN